MRLRAHRPALVLTAGVLAAVTGLSTATSFAGLLTRRRLVSPSVGPSRSRR